MRNATLAAPLLLANPRRWFHMAAVLATLALAGCSGDDDPSDPGDPTGDPSILGASAASYGEGQEVSNSIRATAEDTGYTLDTDGLRITGSFEASGQTSIDYYLFDTGPFTHVDVETFIGGASHAVQITLDSYSNDGYSTLTGYGYFINAWLSGTNRTYVLGVYGATPGASYVIEMKGR